MGDLNASDWAVEAHTSLLSATGTYPAAERILNRHPFPRSRRVQGVVVDDRFILTIGPPDDHDLHGSVDDIFHRSAEGYQSAGLRVSEKKTRIKEPCGTVVGAYVDGNLGTAAAHPSR